MQPQACTGRQTAPRSVSHVTDEDLPALPHGAGRASIMGVTTGRARTAPATDVLERLTDLCLALPEAEADDRHPPHRGYRVAGRNFAWYTENEHGDGRIALCVRTAPQENAALVDSDPERFGLPKYVARHGWVNYFLDLTDRAIDWREVKELVHDSYRVQAPKRLARLVDP